MRCPLAAKAKAARTPSTHDRRDLGHASQPCPTAAKTAAQRCAPLPCPLLVQLVNLACRVDVEMKPSTRRPLALLRQHELNLSASNESKSWSTRLPRRQEPLLLIRPSESEPEAEHIDIIRYAVPTLSTLKMGRQPNRPLLSPVLIA